MCHSTLPYVYGATINDISIGSQFYTPSAHVLYWYLNQNKCGELKSVPYKFYVSPRAYAYCEDINQFNYINRTSAKDDVFHLMRA